MASDILIVDDEEDIRELVAGILSDEGHETRPARDSDSALAAIADRAPRLVFLDIWLQGSKLDGLALLDQIKTLHPNLPIVMISGHGTIETAVSAIKRGAYDFIEKPFKADRLILIAERALETSKLRREVSDLKQRSGESFDLILCNPPYVNSGSMDVLPEEYRHEPQLALAGGADGMDLVRRILEAAPRYLSENGVLVLEIGHERPFFEAAFPELSPMWLDTEQASDQILLFTREQLTT